MRVRVGVNVPQKGSLMRILMTDSGAFVQTSPATPRTRTLVGGEVALGTRVDQSERSWPVLLGVPQEDVVGGQHQRRHADGHHVRDDRQQPHYLLGLLVLDDLFVRVSVGAWRCRRDVVGRRRLHHTVTVTAARLRGGGVLCNPNTVSHPRPPAPRHGDIDIIVAEHAQLTDLSCEGRQFR